jgi:hypothetical protein
MQIPKAKVKKKALHRSDLMTAKAAAQPKKVV